MQPALTAYEDLQLTEVEDAVDLKLQNNVSVGGQVASTREIDAGTKVNNARVLATQVVIPQRRRCLLWWDVRHAHNEIVRCVVSYKNIRRNIILELDWPIK